jgi:hypothetical protein
MDNELKPCPWCLIASESLEADIEALEAENAALRAEIERLRLRARFGSCMWMEDDEGVWHSSCGDAFVLNDGGPIVNNMDYCCYCGLSMIEYPAPEKE